MITFYHYGHQLTHLPVDYSLVTFINDRCVVFPHKFYYELFVIISFSKTGIRLGWCPLLLILKKHFPKFCSCLYYFPLLFSGSNLLCFILFFLLVFGALHSSLTLLFTFPLFDTFLKWCIPLLKWEEHLLYKQCFLSSYFQSVPLFSYFKNGW